MSAQPSRPPSSTSNKSALEENKPEGMSCCGNINNSRSENGDRVAPYITSLVYFRQTPSFINLSNLAGHFTFLARLFISPLILYLIPPLCSCQASANLYVRRRRTGRAKGRMGQFYQESCSYDGRSQLDDRSSL